MKNVFAVAALTLLASGAVSCSGEAIDPGTGGEVSEAKELQAPRVGNSNNGSKTDTLQNYVVYFKHTAGSAFSATTMKINLASGSTATADKLAMAIYADKDGSPGALLRATATGSALSTAGWNSLNLTSPLALTQGQVYWLAIASNSKKYVVKGDADSTPSTNRYFARTFDGTWPNPMPAASSQWGIEYNLYVEGAAAGNTANLSWTAPTQNTDGSALTDLAGYKVYNRSPSNVVTSKSIGKTTSYAWTGLPTGTSTFWVTAVNTAGVESAPSSTGTKTFQ